MCEPTTSGEAHCTIRLITLNLSTLHAHSKELRSFSWHDDFTWMAMLILAFHAITWPFMLIEYIIWPCRLFGQAWPLMLTYFSLCGRAVSYLKTRVHLSKLN